MGITYDNEANAAYLSLVEEARVARTIEVTSSVYVDVDENGAPLGVELLYPARELPMAELRKHLKPEELRRVSELWQSLRRVLNRAANRSRGN